MRPPSYFPMNDSIPQFIFGTSFFFFFSVCFSFYFLYPQLYPFPSPKKVFRPFLLPYLKCSFLGRNKNIQIRFDRCLPSIFERNQTRRTVQTCKEEKRQKTPISLLYYSKLRTCLRKKKTKEKNNVATSSKQLFMPIRQHPLSGVSRT